jgi:hypothetical protein
MSKSTHVRTDVNQKRVEVIDDKIHRTRERQIKQTLHNLSLDDDFDELDLDCRERIHHKAALK